MALAGHLFVEGIDLVSHVAEAIETEPGIFPDVTVCPKDLMDRQRRALALQGLSKLLGNLARRAADLALIDQVGAVQDAMMIVQQVRADATLPFPPAFAEKRKRAMYLAERVLRKRQERKVRRAKRRALRQGTEPPKKIKKKASPAQRVAARRSLAALIDDFVGSSPVKTNNTTSTTKQAAAAPTGRQKDIREVANLGTAPLPKAPGPTTKKKTRMSRQR